MESFKAMYKILKFLEAAMQVDVFPMQQFNGNSFDISDVYFRELVKLLSDDGYITGVSFIHVLGVKHLDMKVTKPAITIKGLEYLSENSLMKKAAPLLMGIVDAVT